MRSSLLLLAFVSLPALACPNLAGNYQLCFSSSNPGTATTLKIDQKIVNKVHQFTFTTQEVSTEEARVEKFNANGKAQVVSETDPDTGITVRTSTTAACSGAVLTIRMNATLDGEALANVTIKNYKDGNKLVQEYSGTTMGEPVNEVITCQ